MRKLQRTLFFRHIFNKKKHFPFSGQIELTYKCNLNCIHCYCKGLEAGYSTIGNQPSADNTHCELNMEEWKAILDEIQKEGCLFLCITGGDPLVREDFLEIYSYARKKGFVITVFTNAYGLSKKILAHLAKYPPYSVEVTLNGITQDTYESITQKEGSYLKVIENIKLLKDNKLELIIKTNCLKVNKDELGRIKRWTEGLLGKPAKERYYFKYDPILHPRLNQDKTPTNLRLSFKELDEVKKQDPDIWKAYQESLHNDFPDLNRDRDFLYQCNAWKKSFFIDPFGRLKFCMLSNKFSVDLKTTSFKEGFYDVFPKILNERFKTNSKCRKCVLRPICYYCPARAYLETGNEEAPVPYYCELAKATAKKRIKL